MFEASKGKLAEVEGKLNALIAEAKSIVPKTEATVRQLGRDVAAPLVHVEARAKQADQTVVQSFAPLKARALQLKPPAG